MNLELKKHPVSKFGDVAVCTVHYSRYNILQYTNIHVLKISRCWEMASDLNAGILISGIKPNSPYLNINTITIL